MSLKYFLLAFVIFFSLQISKPPYVLNNQTDKAEDNSLAENVSLKNAEHDTEQREFESQGEPNKAGT